MSRWMLDLGVNREFQFSGVLLTQEGKKKSLLIIMLQAFGIFFAF